MDALMKISDPALCEEDAAWLRSLRLSVMPYEDEDNASVAAEQEPTSAPNNNNLGDQDPVLVQKHSKQSTHCDAHGPSLRGAVQMKIRHLEERAFAKLAHRHKWLRSEQQLCQELLVCRAFLPLMMHDHRRRHRPNK